MSSTHRELFNGTNIGHLTTPAYTYNTVHRGQNGVHECSLFSVMYSSSFSFRLERLLLLLTSAPPPFRLVFNFRKQEFERCVHNKSYKSKYRIKNNICLINVTIIIGVQLKCSCVCITNFAVS